LHESVKTITYQGEKLNQNNSIIFKLLEAKYPTVKTLDRLKHEYLIRPNFNHESLGYLTARVAREIRNPLKCVNNYAEMSVELREKLLE
jgi:hypothetical protein